MTSPITVYHAINGQLQRKGRAAVTPPVKNSMVFGMYNSCSVSGADGGPGGPAAGVTASNWKAIHDTYMPSSNAMIARTFNSGFPTTWSGAQGKAYTDLGISCLQSVKADPTQVAAGQWDSSIQSLAASVPLGSGLCYYHEPENDMAGTTWVPAFQRFYDQVKIANPNVWVAAIHMTYQWQSGMSSTANMDDWNLHGKCDVLCADTYYMTAGRYAFSSIQNDSWHMRWHNWAYPQGKPLGIAEFGASQKHEDLSNGVWSTTYTMADSVRANFVGNSIDWMYQNNYRYLSLWHSVHGYNGTDANGNPTGYKDMNYTRSVSDPTDYPLTLSAWNNRIANYGQTNPNPTSTIQ